MDVGSFTFFAVVIEKFTRIFSLLLKFKKISKYKQSVFCQAKKCEPRQIVLGKTLNSDSRQTPVGGYVSYSASNKFLYTENRDTASKK